MRLLIVLLALVSLSFSGCPAGASDCFLCGSAPCTTSCTGAWDENAQMHVSCECPQGEPCTCHCPYGGGAAVSSGGENLLDSASECGSRSSCPSCAEIKSMEGTVAVMRNGQWCLAYEGLIVGPEDKVWTLNDSRAGLAYYDGTKQDMNQQSSFTIKDSATTKSGAAGSLVLQGVQGAYHFLVDDKRIERYEMRLDNAVIGIEGTEFLVDGGDSGITVSVIEGKVNLSSSKFSKTVLLGEGEASTVPANGAPSEPSAFGNYDKWWQGGSCCASAMLLLLLGIGIMKKD